MVSMPVSGLCPLSVDTSIKSRGDTNSLLFSIWGGLSSAQLATIAFPDVVKFIDKTYRTQANKKGRAIAGLSMGGYHSMHISKQYPDMFDYVGLFSAAIMPNKDVKSPIYDNLEAKLKTQFAKKPALYYIAIGNKDFLFQANSDYRKMLDEKGYKYEYYETGEGHIWKNWRIYLTEFAPKIFK